MHQLLSTELWPTVAALSQNHRRLRAAISYVTTADFLDFRAGDVLVCDASDGAIKSGMTSAKILRAFASQGASLFSLEGLHAKTLLFDGHAVIGSANLSGNAGVYTTEAALLTDDVRTAALARGFIEQVRKGAKRVDESFLRRIESIPVVRSGRMTGRKRKPVASSESRIWLVSTSPRGNKVEKSEAAVEKKGMAEAKRLLMNVEDEIESLRWTGKSRFRSEAQPGHLVIQAYREKRGLRTFTEVYRPVPIIHREDSENCTFFYLEVPPDADEFYCWSGFKSELVRLGIKSASPNSTRELTGQSQHVIDWFSTSH